MEGASDRFEILIVCHANTSRSVMAQALLQWMLESRGAAERFRVRSGGIAYYARDGALTSLDAKLALREHGIELPPDSVATDLKANRHLLGAADLILAMTGEQIRMLRESFPESYGKEVRTLRELAGRHGDIDDPAGQDESVFAACCAEIRACLEESLEALLARPSVDA
jgi:protein-tyrosine phosphatase